MKLIIDTDQITLTQELTGESRTLPLYSDEAFQCLSQQWLRVGWGQKYTYSFTWLGRPVIQLPEDMIRVQEVIYAVKPDVIVETGVAHGGSLVFYASLFKLLGRGRVIGVDIEIRPHNRRAIEWHELASSITLVEGDSKAPEVVAKVRQSVRPHDRVLVLLDSCHTKAHVLAELTAYSPLVTPGSYIVVMDGLMPDLVGVPGSESDWSWNNPLAAVREFVAAHPEFVVEEPAFAFNESKSTRRVTYWPAGFVKRIA